MKDLFKRTMSDIDAYSQVLKSLAQHAIDLGMKEEHLNVQRVYLKVDAALRDYLKKDKEAKELGYTSFATAWKAFTQTKQNQFASYINLPEVFHTVPWIWLKGKHPAKNDPGFPPMSLTQAQRKHRTVIPLILEMWQLFEGDETCCDQLVKDYLRLSADQFEKMVYKWIYDLEEVTIEQEFTNRLEATSEELEACLKLATDKSRIYGVTKDKLDSPEWD